MVGVALQSFLLAFWVVPSADISAISYVGVPLTILFVHANNI